MKIADYDILVDEPHLIARTVKSLIDIGWEPLGPPLLCAPTMEGDIVTMLAQAMVKPSPEPTP